MTHVESNGNDRANDAAFVGNSEWQRMENQYFLFPNFHDELRESFFEWFDDDQETRIIAELNKEFRPFFLENEKAHTLLKEYTIYTFFRESWIAGDLANPDPNNNEFARYWRGKHFATEKTMQDLIGALVKESWFLKRTEDD
ncbi:MAG: hypothetical protein Q9166_005705 [cf. Caloplaca sp. 2 TL-2023]